MRRRFLLWAGIAFAVLLALIQLVPYGRDHTNPPVGAEPAWDSPRTRELAARSCFACHGNTTKWPWYSNIAPASWLVQHDVEEARAKLNFQDWGRAEEQEADEAAEVVAEGEMPLWYYLILHPRARLSDSEREPLSQGLRAIFGEHSD